MKKILYLFLSLSVCACGFRPMYSGSTASDIYIAPISGTNGIDLRNSLKSKFGTGGRYTLSVDLKEPQTIFKGIEKTGDATWQEVRLAASYTLKEGGKVIVKGMDSASESYTFVRDLVAAQASYGNAVQSAIRILSDKIETRINAELAQ